MTDSPYQDLGFGITCIDAAYVEYGMACFYLMEEGGECAVLETGTCHSVPALHQLLANKGIAARQVRYVIPTHVHLDHAGGAGTMMAAFPEATLLMHPRGARHMADPQRLIAGSMAVYGEETFGKLYGTIEPVAESRIREMADGETVELAGRPLEFRHTRGHAEHHFCIWDEASRGWFSGDMFGISYPWFRFENGDFLLPATTPTQFDPDAYLASLELLAGYSPQRMYLTHHGALDWSMEKSALLAEQVEAYRETTLAEGADAGSLKKALEAYSLDLIRRYAGAADENSLRRMLAFDMDLNSQGLQVWWERNQV